MPFPSTITTTIERPQLRLLSALRANARPIITFMGLPSFRTAQVIAQTGLDVRINLHPLHTLSSLIVAKGIIIDCEHGHISDDAMHSATAAIAAFGVSPLVRIRMSHGDLIKRALDAGAQ